MMKNIVEKFFCSAILVLTSVVSAHAVADVITLRADEWCPYNCTPGAKQPGIMVEVARRVFESAGHKVDYQILSWARAIEDTRQGKFVGIIGAARSDAPDFIFPAEDLGTSRTAFVVRRADKWEFAGVEGLPARTLGVIRDYSYSERLDAYVEANKGSENRIQVASGDNALELNLRKLQRGRIDTVMDGEWVLKYTLSSLNLGKELRLAGGKTKATLFISRFPPPIGTRRSTHGCLATGLRVCGRAASSRQSLTSTVSATGNSRLTR